VLLALFPWPSVPATVCFGQLAVAHGFIGQVGMKGFGHHCPKQLSGRMQQRTALARAPAKGPRMLPMDEPSGALDHQTRGLMQELRLGIREAEREPLMFVSHDIDEAVFMGRLGTAR
jgi:ABC-type nitrate/sulfonate/bicarbonate transport system ATPase subunit